MKVPFVLSDRSDEPDRSLIFFNGLHGRYGQNGHLVGHWRLGAKSPALLHGVWGSKTPLPPSSHVIRSTRCLRIRGATHRSRKDARGTPHGAETQRENNQKTEFRGQKSETSEVKVPFVLSDRSTNQDRSLIFFNGLHGRYGQNGHLVGHWRLRREKPGTLARCMGEQKPPYPPSRTNNMTRGG